MVAPAWLHVLVPGAAENPRCDWFRRAKKEGGVVLLLLAAWADWLQSVPRQHS